MWLPQAARVPPLEKAQKSSESVHLRLLELLQRIRNFLAIFWPLLDIQSLTNTCQSTSLHASDGLEEACENECYICSSGLRDKAEPMSLQAMRTNDTSGSGPQGGKRPYRARE